MKNITLIIVYLSIAMVACRKSDKIVANNGNGQSTNRPDSTNTTSLQTINYNIFDSSFGYYGYLYYGDTNLQQWQSFYTVTRSISLIVDSINGRCILYSTDTLNNMPGVGYYISMVMGFRDTQLTISHDSVTIYHSSPYGNLAHYYSYVRGYRIP